MAATAYGVPNWVLASVALAFALVLYYLLRKRVPLWLLIPLVIVLAPVGVLVAIVGAMFLTVWSLTLYSMLSLRIYGGVGIGYWETHPRQLYLLGVAAVLLTVAVIAYLIGRR